MTATTELSTQPAEPSPRPGRGPLVQARNAWRRLTSMRTALVLLFLLALAAIPGSLLPQTKLNPAKVQQYIAQHPTLAPILQKLGFFQVFASPWFAAIYLLLFISLIGCILPRVRLHLRALRAAPPAAPRRFDRLPQSSTYETSASPEEVLAAAKVALRGWRTRRRTPSEGVETLSAERGYLRETGNIVFHVALTVLLAGIAIGKLWGYEGNVLLDEGRGFCNTVQSYDQFSAGSLVTGADSLTPFCVDMDSFTASYDADGTPAEFEADIRYGPGTTEGRTDRLRVNHPLRLDGVRVYLISHGFTPTFTVTTSTGQVFEGVSAPFLPQDANFTSEGTLKLPDAQPQQLAIDGLFAPSAVDTGDGVITSNSPQATNPAVAIFVYQGDLGLDTGQAQSVYQLDQGQIASGALKRVGAANLTPGQSTKLADGTTVRFDGYTEWATLQVSRDPGQLIVLVAFGFLLAGLLLSTWVRRRRVWVRASLSGEGESARTVVEVGGLARTEAGGFTDEFARILDRVRAPGKD